MDSTGQKSTDYVLSAPEIFVDDLNGLTEVDEVPSPDPAVSSYILDVDATRILYSDINGTLWIHDRTTCTETVVAVNLNPRNAFLTPSGVAMDAFLWTNGTLQPVDPWTAAIATVNGTWAAGTDGNGNAAMLIDLTTGARQTFPGPYYGISGTAVGSNGDLITLVTNTPCLTSCSGTVTRYRSGTPTVVNAYAYQGTSLKTDGGNVLYNTPNGELHLFDSNGLDTVLTASASVASAAVTGGWTVFSAPVVGGNDEVFVRDPQGTVRQVTSFGAQGGAGVDAARWPAPPGVTGYGVDPDGGVMLIGPGGRYFAGFGQAPLALNGGAGYSLYRDGAWYVVLYHKLYQPTSMAGPPSCSPAAVAANDGPVCDGADLHLSAASVPSATYSWSGPNGFASTEQSPTVMSVSAADAGTYTVTATTPTGSTRSSTLVTVIPLPDAPTATNDSPVCAGDDVHLHADGAPGAAFA